MFQIDLNSELKEEPDLKSGCLHYLTWYCKGPEYAWIYWNVPKCGQVFLDMYNFVIMPEYAWNITCLNKPGL